ncbi:MAG: 6-bladed beta-propeller, partial [Rhodothermaceae bacterium]|nr:6-bladed beta-propeller [Rhodothermaceae bacterium]
MLGILVRSLLTKYRAEESSMRTRFLFNLCHCAAKATRLREWRPVMVCASRLRIVQVVLTILFVGVLPSSTLVGQPRAVEEEIAFTEILRVGEETDESAYLFGRIVGLAVDSKDRILVADLRPPSVAVFSVDGEWLGSVGGVGEGPGEFISVDGVHVSPSDSVYVVDIRNGSGPPRLNVYDPTDFTYVRQIQFPYDGDWGSVSSAVGVSDHGPIMGYNTMMLPDNVGEPLHSYAVLTSWAGERIHELARLPDRDMYFGLSPDGNLFAQQIKYAPSSVFRLSASQLFYSGLNAEIDILV